jgi:aspartyl-tRNA(Asn)/glutamyl-tRNA(Gln) amidotransferase subunit C
MTEIISKEEIRHIAWLSKIHVSDEEEATLIKQFNEILKFFSKLDEVDTSSVSLELYVTPVRDVLREDKVEPSLKISDALINAPKKEDKFFKAPKIV